jgi:hypothetical protein
MSRLIHTREVAGSIPAAPKVTGPGNRAFPVPWEEGLFTGEACLERHRRQAAADFDRVGNLNFAVPELPHGRRQGHRIVATSASEG